MGHVEVHNGIHGFIIEIHNSTISKAKDFNISYENRFWNNSKPN